MAEKLKRNEISLLKRYIKKVDPDSVVRESELMSHPAASEFMKRLRKSKDPDSVVRESEKLMMRKGRR
jgi:hypothetical protein|tara:strand:+ start:22 stop:225 length:204 start_codon:yes stop_codon:yes gene_type:complete